MNHFLRSWVIEKKTGCQKLALKKLKLSSSLIGQTRNRAAQKINLLLPWWNFEIMIHATLSVKKIHFSSSSMALFSIGFSQLRFKTLTLALYCSLPHLHCLHEHQVHHRQLAIFFLWARKKEIKKWRLLPLLPAFILSSTPKISIIPTKQVYFIN